MTPNRDCTRCRGLLQPHCTCPGGPARDEAQDTGAAAAMTVAVQVWCETCEGTGTVHHESQHGVPGSGGDFPCPDCDGNGYVVKHYARAAAAAAQPEATAMQERDAGVELLPCPHCGSASAPMFWTSLDARDESCDCDDGGNPLMHFVVCDASKPDGKGGCGASGGFFLDKAAARAAWNRRAAAGAPAAPAVPEGWRLVPVEATDAMVDATYHGQPVCDIYRDMLAAAPEAPTAQAAPEQPDAVAWVTKRRDDFIAAHGYADPSTGCLEFGQGAHAEAKREYVGELDEIIEGLQSLACAAPLAQAAAAPQPLTDERAYELAARYDVPVSVICEIHRAFGIGTEAQR